MIDLHSITIRDKDIELLKEVGKICKVKVLSFSSSLLDRVDISSFKFLENLTIDWTNNISIILKHKVLIAIKHLILNNVNSI